MRPAVQSVADELADNGYVAGEPFSISTVYPVGCVYTSVMSTNPNTLFGFGTWTAFASGRVLIGVDAGQSEFDAPEKLSGSKTHSISEAELPSHTHAVTDAGHSHLTQRYPTATGGSTGFTADTSMSGTPADNTLSTKAATTGITIGNTGSSQAISLLQPGICVYFFLRES